MLLRLSVLFVIVSSLLIGFTGSTATPLHGPQLSSTLSSTAADTTKPLRPLMMGLAQDMDRISTGLWTEDYELIEEGGQSIADHPRIPPEQIAKIKEALGSEFQNFVGYDQSVHDTALDLVQAAQARDWSEVLDTHERLKRGCTGCHTAYRDRLRPVLRP